MVEQLWEKPKQSNASKSSNNFERYKFLIAGGLMLVAVVSLIIFSTQSGAQYFITIDELVATSIDYVGQSSRISGAVVGDVYECNDSDSDTSNDCRTCDVQNQICYDTENIIIEFTIAHIPQQTDDLERTLHDAVKAVEDGEDITTLVVRYEGVKPDLLQNEAQAILTGKLQEDGKFYAAELLLKCPSRYGEEVPDQTGNEGT